MDNRDNSAGAIAVIAIGLPMLGLLMFSRSIGADFLTTGSAVLRSAMFIAVAGILWYFLKTPIRATSFGILTFIWPCWWRVLDSIALGGIDPDQPNPLSLSFLNEDRFLPWWDTDWCKYGVLFLLMAVCAYFIYKAYQDRY